MRASECSLSPTGKQAVLELILAGEHSVRIRRTKDAGGAKEEWRIGPLIRYEWCHLREDEAARWHITFGGNFKLPVILEPIFSKVISENESCAWIWPKEEPNQPPEPMPLKRHGSS